MIMAEKYHSMCTEDIASGLFSECQEEAEDAPSDGETDSHRSDVETEKQRDDFFSLPQAVAVYSDDEEEKDDEAIEAKRKRLSDTISLSQRRLIRKFTKNTHIRSLKVRKKVGETNSSDLTHSPGPLKAAREATTPLRAWSLLFNDDLLDKIVLRTNQEIERSRACTESTATCNNDTTRAELSALIGLLYFSGLPRNNSANPEELWSTHFGSSLYQAAMPLQEDTNF